jgi:hypothetical protein
MPIFDSAISKFDVARPALGAAGIRVAPQADLGTATPRGCNLFDRCVLAIPWLHDTSRARMRADEVPLFMGRKRSVYPILAQNTQL